MNRYETVFTNLDKLSRGALVPFLMLAEPDVEQCLEWVDMLVENGADALELGMAFSDPVADGAVIQQSAISVLKNNTTVDDSFNLIAKIRKKYPDIPLGLLTYANLVVARGLNRFYRSANMAGLDSVLLADIPVHGIEAFVTAATDHQVLPILIAPPNATDIQLQHIASCSKGYTYVVSRAGVTGADKVAGVPVAIINKLAELDAAPALSGFGIATTDDVKKAIAAGCSGVICGSALVKIQQQYTGSARLQKGTELMQQLKQGLFQG